MGGRQRLSGALGNSNASGGPAGRGRPGMRRTHHVRVLRHLLHPPGASGTRPLSPPFVSHLRHPVPRVVAVAERGAEERPPRGGGAADGGTQGGQLPEGGHAEVVLCVRVRVWRGTHTRTARGRVND